MGYLVHFFNEAKEADFVYCETKEEAFQYVDMLMASENSEGGYITQTFFDDELIQIQKDREVQDATNN